MEAGKLFGTRHYRAYTFLIALSDQTGFFAVEHHECSDNRMPEKALTTASMRAFVAALLPHEYTHSWNGKFRRPADLWTPNYNVPMQNSLLWVYEGQTQYWGLVLAARSGLRTRQQALDEMADTAAYYDELAGRQ